MKLAFFDDLNQNCRKIIRNREKMYFKFRFSSEKYIIIIRAYIFFSQAKIVFTNVIKK